MPLSPTTVEDPWKKWKEDARQSRDALDFSIATNLNRKQKRRKNHQQLEWLLRPRNNEKPDDKIKNDQDKKKSFFKKRKATLQQTNQDR